METPARFTSMGIQILTLLKEANTPLTLTAAKVIEDLQEQLKAQENMQYAVNDTLSFLKKIKDISEDMNFTAEKYDNAMRVAKDYDKDNLIYWQRKSLELGKQLDEAKAELVTMRAMVQTTLARNS